MTGEDVGREPALTCAAYVRDESPGRRMLNIRWMACTVLTGLVGAALMGGALLIAFDHQADFAVAPHAPLVGADAESGAVELGRADRLSLRSERISSRQIIQQSTVRTVGGKEFVQVMPYVRVVASLTSVRGAHGDEIPTFNPNEIFASVGAMATKGEADNADDQESIDGLQVSFSPLSPASSTGGGEFLDVAEIEQMLRETFSRSQDALAYAPAPLFPVATPGVGGAGAVDMHGAMVAGDLFRAAAGSANTTTIVKRYRSPLDQAVGQHGVEVGRGDTLMSILVAHGATPSEAMDIIAKLEAEDARLSLREGETVFLTMAAGPDDAERRRPVGVTLRESDGDSIVAGAEQPSFLRQLSTLGSLGLRRTSAVVEPVKAAARPNAPAQASQRSRANVYEAIYETGLSHDVPRPLIDELVRIFAFDVDFQRSVSLGDAIELFYAETGEDQAAEEPEILFAAVSLRGDTHRFYRFRHPEDGVVDYYDESGKSAKKFLMRKPISGGTFRSGFGMRRHPLLGYTRMHNGVDWAARTGTPIMAAGGGTVIKAEWHGGYGRHVLIRHANGYETSYSHLSGYGDGIQPGARVHQGQVIGYVGSTGMSTGPHLHYEVTVNGRNVDPMRIRLPRGRTLEGRALYAFEKEMARIEALMNRAPTSTRLAAR